MSRCPGMSSSSLTHHLTELPKDFIGGLPLEVTQMLQVIQNAGTWLLLKEFSVQFQDISSEVLQEKYLPICSDTWTRLVEGFSTLWGSIGMRTKWQIFSPHPLKYSPLEMQKVLALLAFCKQIKPYLVWRGFVPSWPFVMLNFCFYLFTVCFIL